VNDREEWTLVTDNGANHEADAIVVDVKRTVGLQPFGIPDDEGNDNSDICSVANQAVAQCNLVEVKVNQISNSGNYANEKGPACWSPFFHRSLCASEVLHRSDVKVRELESKKHVRGHPKPEVPVKKLVFSIFMATRIFCMSELTHVVTLLDRMQEQEHVVVRLNYGLNSVGVLVKEVSGAEVYGGWVVLGLVRGAVAREVFLLTKHDNSTHHKEDWGEYKHLFEGLVGMVAASKGVAALYVDKADEGPAINAQSHEHYELGQGEPSSVDSDAVIPTFKHL